MNESILLSALGIVASCVAIIGWVIKYMFEQLVARMQKGNELMDTNNDLLKELKELTRENSQITKSADQYLRDRNGRDAKIHEKQMETAHALHKELINAIHAIPDTITKTEQNIETQNVQHQRRKRKRLTNKTKKN